MPQSKHRKSTQTAITKWAPPRRPPMPPDEVLRTVGTVIGYSMVAFSHPHGFVAGLQGLVLEQTRAKRWKALAKKYRRELLALRAPVRKAKPKAKSLRRRA
jgi:hypothetical protein